ncbi:MAG: hypothetical protein E5W76_17225 [Mesorhizobium sp.]|nr:MAG: hypothetical protein E5W76_17225 [Mesorhizobium sp.]
MSEVRTPPVKATYVHDLDIWNLAVLKERPGAFDFYTADGRERAGMIYICPCGCGATGALAFRPAPSPSWEWDGNEEAPTLSPSVHHVGHWHGYLRAGIWESC